MPPDKLSIVVFSGDFTRVHYALCMASSAAAVGRPATLFFTMKAVHALLAEGGAGGPGWHDLAPADDGGTAEAIDAAFAARGVATFEGLLEACAELGVRFMVCEMGLKAEGVLPEALRRDLDIAEGGLVTFMADASADGAMVFI